MLTEAEVRLATCELFLWLVVSLVGSHLETGSGPFRLLIAFAALPA